MPFPPRAAKAWETQAKQRYSWCPADPQNAKFHRKGADSHDLLQFQWKWKGFMRNHIIVVEFSISEANGASETPLFCLRFLCFCSRGRKDTPSHIKLLTSVKINETSWKLCVFMKFVYLSPNGCPFPRGLQNHRKHKQTKVFLMSRWPPKC